MDDVLTVVEAAYRIDLPESDWLAGIARAARPQFPGCLGAACFTYDITAAGLMEMPAVEWRGDVEGITGAGLQRALVNHPASVVAELYEKVRFGFATDPPAYRQATSPAYYRPRGIVDWLGVNGLDLAHHGCCVILAFAERREVDPALRERWTRVAAHLAAARRLRGRLAARESRTDHDADVEAILKPNGDVEHATGEAGSVAARAALRQALLRIEKARGSLRRTAPDQALAEWRGLTAARWSLVEQIEHGGQRFVLARRNDVDAPGPSALSARERQVVAHAALAKTNKIIAYELGISPSTVGVLMSRAMQKLGVRSRADAIAAWRAAIGAP